MICSPFPLLFIIFLVGKEGKREVKITGRKEG